MTVALDLDFAKHELAIPYAAARAVTPLVAAGQLSDFALWQRSFPVAACTRSASRT